MGGKRQRAITCVAYALATIACATVGHDAPLVSGGDQARVTAMTSTTVRVRVGNRSDMVFDRVVVRFPAQEEAYGRIPAQGYSDYRSVQTAYRYAHLEVTVDGRALALRPMDYVGETPLSPGDYTYAVAVVKTDGVPSRLELSLIRD